MQERTGIGPGGRGLAGVLVALVVSACGGGSGVSSPRGIAAPAPSAIVSQATRAVEKVSSVRVTGTIDGGLAGHSLALDLSIVSGHGATGSVAEGGVSFRLVTVGGNDYINGTPAFWSQFGDANLAAQLRGRWLRAPVSSREFASLATITDLHTLLGALLGGHGALTEGGRSTIDGHRVVALHDASGHGTLYVATTAPRYPIRLTRTGPEGGRLDFGDFGARVRILAPAPAVGLSALTGG